MLHFLYILDLQLFLIINKKISNPIFDIIFTFLHQPYKNIWFIIIILSIWIYFIYKHKKNRLILILILPLGIFITDKIGDSIKDFELRNRPYMTINNEEINLLVKVKKTEDGKYKNTRSSKKSFPSNHSANIFFIYFILSILYPNKNKYFLFIAMIIGISRIYVGVHYPFDVISGAAIGLSIGFVIKKILIRQNIIR
tara:strand:+ start:5296 stop:5886 length:591 start_codon:yes stop_codon:yes gene_type:complete